MASGEPRKGRAKIVKARVDNGQYDRLVEMAKQNNMTLSDYIMSAAYAYVGEQFVSSAKRSNGFLKAAKSSKKKGAGKNEPAN